MDNVVKIFDNTLEYIPSDKGLNYIICDDYSEVFFGVYQVTINGSKFIGEGVDTIKGSPVIKIPVILEDKTHDVLFALKADSNETGIVINLNSLSNGRKVLLDEKKEAEQIVEEVGLEPIEEIVEEVNVTSEELKVDIERYKKDALRVISENFNDKKAKLESLQESLKNVINKNVEDLKQSTLLDLQEFKTDVISSVETIVESNKIDTDSSIAEINSLKENISVLVNGYVADLELTASEKVAALNELREQVNFEVSTKLHEFESEVNSYKQITEEEFKKLEKYIAESEQNLISKNQSGVEANQKLLDAIVEKSTDITKFVESKVSSLQSFTDKKTASIAKAIETKLAEFDNKTKIVDEKVDLIEKTLSEKVVDYIGEFTAAVNEKLSGINAIKADIESAGDTQASKLQQIGDQLIEAVETKVKNANLVAVKKEDLSSLKKQLEERINTESANLKKYVAGYGGGGSVAQQFAAGGTINGTLDVTGQILSAGQDLFSLFSGGGGSGYQTLTYNQNTAALTITPFGNTVSLSALSGSGGSGVSYLSALNDVSIPAPVNGQVLTYNTFLNKWTAGTPVSASGATGYYGSFYDERNQSATSSTSAYVVAMSGTFESNGVSLSSDNVIFQYPGTYELIYSIQIVSSHNNQADVQVWYTRNGVDIPTSNSVFTVYPKSGNETGKIIMVTPFIVTTTTGGEAIGLKWNAAHPGISISSLSANTTPPIPASPGVILTVKQVTNVQVITAGGSGVDTGVRALTANWQNTYTTVSANSASWQNTYTNFSVQSANNISVYSTVNSNSATWNAAAGGTQLVTNLNYTRWQLAGDGTTTIFSITGASSDIEESYLVTLDAIVQDPISYTVSAAADTITFSSPPLSGSTIIVVGTVPDIAPLTILQSSSANWNSAYNFSTNQGASVYSTVNANSATWGTGGAGGAYLPLSGGTLTGAVSTNQDIEITDSTKGIILKSPSNIKYRVTVNDAGELVTTLV